MDLFLRAWAVLLFLAGVPLFFGLGTGLGTLAFMEPPNSPGAVEKFLQTYAAFALSGLLTASGAVLWAVARMGYPLKEKR
jgi:hypothetical protein